MLSVMIFLYFTIAVSTTLQAQTTQVARGSTNSARGMDTTQGTQLYEICGENGCRGYSEKTCPVTMVTATGTVTMCDTYKDLGCKGQTEVPCKNGKVSFKLCCIGDKCLNMCEDAPATTQGTQLYKICGEKGCRGYSEKTCPVTMGAVTMCDTYKDLGCKGQTEVP